MYNYDNLQLVSKIRRILYQRGLSPAKVESALSWSPGLISRWTKSSPSFDKIMELVEYLEITVDDLLSENNERTKCGHISISDLISKLYTAGRIWYPIDDRDDNLEKMVDPLIKDGLLAERFFYYKYKNGFFILATTPDDSLLSLRLYVTPDSDTVPQLVSDSKELLEKLLYNADQNYYSLIVKQKTDDFLNDYLFDK